MNAALRDQSRSKVKKWRDYIWLLMHALQLLPPAPEVTLYRATNRGADTLGGDYADGKQFVWSGFSSTATTIDVMKFFMGKQGTPRTIFQLEVLHNCGRDVKALSLFGRENEVLLPPNAQFQVVSKLACGGGLTIVQCRQVESTDAILALSSKDEKEKVKTADAFWLAQAALNIEKQDAEEKAAHLAAKRRETEQKAAAEKVKAAAEKANATAAAAAKAAAEKASAAAASKQKAAAAAAAAAQAAAAAAEEEGFQVLLAQPMEQWDSKTLSFWVEQKKLKIDLKLLSDANVDGSMMLTFNEKDFEEELLVKKKLDRRKITSEIDKNKRASGYFEGDERERGGSLSLSKSDSFAQRTRSNTGDMRERGSSLSLSQSGDRVQRARSNTTSSLNSSTSSIGGGSILRYTSTPVNQPNTVDDDEQGNNGFLPLKKRPGARQLLQSLDDCEDISLLGDEEWSGLTGPVRRFIQKQIETVRSTPELLRNQLNLLDRHKLMYADTMVLVRSDPLFAPMAELVEQLRSRVVQRARIKYSRNKGKPCQQHTDLREVYGDAFSVADQYHALMDELESKSKCVYVEAERKSIWRSHEKTGLRADKQWDASCTVLVKHTH
jgi:hypothetical protein